MTCLMPLPSAQALDGLAWLSSAAAAPAAIAHASTVASPTTAVRTFMRSLPFDRLPPIARRYPAAAQRATPFTRWLRPRLGALVDRLVARHREADQERYVDRVDDERQRQHDELPAARAVLDEDVLEHAGGDRVGQRRPLGDEEEHAPVEAAHAPQRNHVDRDEGGGGGEQHHRRAERDVMRQVRGDPDAADDDERHRGDGDLGDGRQALVDRSGDAPFAHTVATLVMITSVATC